MVGRAIRHLGMEQTVRTVRSRHGIAAQPVQKLLLLCWAEDYAQLSSGFLQAVYCLAD